MRTLTRLAPGLFAALFVAAPLAAQGFGTGVAIHSGQILVSEPGGPTTTGAVHIFARDGDGWTLAGDLRAEGLENGARFGTSLWLSSDRMLVGSPGAAYVFERSADGWREAGVLVTESAPEGTTFGMRGVIEGDVALVAALGRGFRGAPAGAVVAFERGADGWREVGLIRPTGSAEDDGFGTAILTNGQVAAISAPGATVGTAQRAGRVVFFARGEDGTWSELGELTAPNPEAGEGFGSALHVEERDGETRMVVGAAGAARGAGTAYAFELAGEDWTLSHRYFPPVVGRRGGGFASSIAASGDELWIGGSGVGARGEGLVLRYGPAEEGSRTLRGVLAADLPGARDGFGSNLAVSGDLAVVVAGGKDYRYGTAYVFERRDGVWLQTDEIWTEPANYAAISGNEVACEDGAAAAFACDEIDVLSFMPVRSLGAGRGVRVNDVWGWTDPQTGREYALVGLTDQASFVDVTDPDDPRYVGRLPMTEGANGSTWRDIKVYRDHAFIVSDGAGEHGMQVFDLRRLRDVGSEPVTFEADAHYDGIASAHNIVINEATGFAYSVGSSGGGETCGGGLHMIDIREPTNPTFAGCFADASTGRRGTGYSHDAMCVVYEGPDAEHAGKEICFGSNETAVSISDVTDKDAPVAISTADYPNVGYAHQGWITEDHRYFYLGDELDEIAQDRQGTPFPGTRTLIWDVSDLDDPVFVGEHFGESTASDHNLYIVGNLMYQSNYNSGLRILDVSDPESPVEVGFLDTVPHAEGPSMGGSWSNYPYFASGTVVVTSGNEGLFMLRHRPPELVP